MRIFSVLFFLLLFSSQGVAAENALQEAIRAFDALSSYAVTMRSYGNSEQVIAYRYQKPGFVRMDFIKPHKGAALVYRPDTGKVKLRPFGIMKPLVLTMKPTARLVRSPSGHRVDESDLGVLLQNAKELAEQGRLQQLREEERLGRLLRVFEVTGEPDVQVGGVHQYLLWMDPSLKLPRIVESYDMDNQLLEGLILEDLVINPDVAGIFQL